MADDAQLPTQDPGTAPAPAPPDTGAAAPVAAPAATPPAPEATPKQIINSPEMAKQVAQLIKDGKITGSGRDGAMKALADYTKSYQYEQKAHGDVKNPADRNSWYPSYKGGGLSGVEPGNVLRGFGAGAQAVGRGITEAVADSPTLMGRAMREKGTDQVVRQQVDAANASKSNQALMNTIGGQIGNVGGNVAASGPLALLPGGETLPGAMAIGAAQGAVQPVGTQGDRTANTALGAVGGPVGNLIGRGAGAIAQKVGRDTKIGQAIASKLPGGTPKPTTPIPNPNITKEARRAIWAGYDLPPSMAKADPSALDHVIEGVGGKIRTEQKFSIKNQDNTDQSARRAIGMEIAPKGEKNIITPRDLEEVREDAGEAYAKIRQLDHHDLPNRVNYLEQTPKFNQALDKIDNSFNDYARRFPSIFRNSKIQAMTRDLRKLKTPDDIIEISNSLRQQANDNLKGTTSKDMALGRAQRAMSRALDEFLEDGLKSATAKSGNKDLGQLYDALIHSRKVIARTYDIEAALDPSGHIDAVKMARIGKKRPLEDELAEIAHFGAHFKGAARVPNRIGSRYGPDVSKTEIGIGSAIAAAGGHTGALKTLAREGAAVFAPSGARSYLTSGRYQSTLGPTLRGEESAQEALKRISTLGGATATLNNPYQNEDEEQK